MVLGRGRVTCRVEFLSFLSTCNDEFVGLSGRCWPVATLAGGGEGALTFHGKIMIC